MKVSEYWLREWVSPDLDTAALAERLTLAGLEVGAVEPAAGPLKNVVVGRILAVEPHPDGERLRVCQVEVGRARPLRIVCGAANAAAGLKVPVALPGAVLPGGKAIARATVRGVESAGMLCSAAELGLEEQSEGLLVLDDDARPGVAIAETLQLDDRILEVELTPNRGDCLSVAGLAREVSALTGARLHPPAMRAVPARSRQSRRVILKARRDCPRYVGRVIEDIDPGARTPLWMCERLRRGGVRPIGPVVDVTNYVMLELGQPMHAFDADRLSGAVQVRQAQAQEALTLLDGRRVELAAGTLVVADDRGPVAVAGVIGGFDSAVSDATRCIFLESAYFQPAAVAGRARSLGLQTESSYRFERGVDPGLQRRAVERATALLLAIAGGRPGPVIEQQAPAQLPKRPALHLRRARLDRVLGLTIPAGEVGRTLKRLGMQVRANGKAWRVVPPSYRFDVAREEDLIEEVIRVHGYEHVPNRRPVAALAPRPAPEGQVAAARLRAVLADRDYQEVITYSFVDPDLQGLLEPAVRPIRLANPLAADMAVMRTRLWPGLIKTLIYNLNRQQTRLRFFELGRCFLPGPDLADQPMRLAGVIAGPVWPKQWGGSERRVDFYDLKADVEAVLALTGRHEDFRFEPVIHPALHPGQAATVTLAGQPVGLLGALHPDLLARLDLSLPAFLFELEISGISTAKLPIFHEISRFPSIRRDIALVVDRKTPAQAVMDCIGRVAGHLLVNLELFDEYRGEGIDSGRKSLALGLTLQDSSRTLKEETVETLMAGVLTALRTELGAELRQ